MRSILNMLKMSSFVYTCLAVIQLYSFVTAYQDLEAELDTLKREILDELYSQEDYKRENQADNDHSDGSHKQMAEGHGVHNGVPMGQPDFRHGTCDDGRTNLQIDWYGGKDDYTCMEPHHWPSQRHDDINWQPTVIKSPEQEPAHICMDQAINYFEVIPTIGPHRPLWPVFGEYKYLPPQRWIHSLEHGAAVALYHPCTDPREVDKMRKVVNNCIFKHIITPYQKLTKEMPIAIIAWGYKILLPYADENVIQQFIRDYAMKGPESRLTQNGQFFDQLIHRATKQVSFRDSNLCPDMKKSDHVKLIEVNEEQH